MSPKTKFSEADIIEAAFRVIRREGWEKCTARTIAQELGSSTMPIYSALKSMRNLNEEIAKRTIDLLLSYQTTPRSGMSFLDMGVGYVIFAQEERQLFSMMHASDVASTQMTQYIRNAVYEKLNERLISEPALEGLPMPLREDIHAKLWIFSHGLAVLLNSGILAPLNTEQVTNMLRDTGGLIIFGELERMRIERIDTQGRKTAKEGHAAPRTKHKR